MDTELKKLTIERGHLKSALTRFVKFFETSSQNTTVESLQDRLEANKQLLDKFNAVQIRIEDIVTDTSSEAMHAAEREQFENTYFDILGAVRKHISRFAASTHTTSPSPSLSSENSESQNNVELPKIAIPEFDGSYNDWVRFRDTFLSLVHDNPKLSNLNKFHYLNGALKGEAARIIQTLGVSRNNYVEAWEAVMERYEDPKALIHHHASALLDLAPVTSKSHKALRQFLDDANNHLLALRALGEQTDTWDVLTVLILSRKLDTASSIEWEKFLLTIPKKPSLRDFMQFVTRQCKFLERIAIIKSSDDKVHIRAPLKQSLGRSKIVNSYVATAPASACPYCRKSHKLVHCEEFRRLSPTARVSKARDLRVCFNCLRPGHHLKDCTSSVCRECAQRHHTLLHIANAKKLSNDRSSSPSQAVPAESAAAVQSYVTRSRNISVDTAILSTAIILVSDKQGIKHECRALLDSGSQSHFLTESKLQKLQLPYDKTNIHVSGIGQNTRSIQKVAEIELISRFNGFRKSISCLIIPTITETLPSNQLRTSHIPIPPGIRLADPDFIQPREIDIIIGAGLFWELLCVGQHVIGPEYPILQKTQLGWIVAGKLHPLSSNGSNTTTCHFITNQDLHNSLSRFWEIEDCSANSNVHTLGRTDHCEQHFISTTIRDEEGRFVVSIPLRENAKELGESRRQAEKRLVSLERKLMGQPELKARYSEFMKEYESLGHMSEVSDSEQGTNVIYYLPHHAVVKETSSTTKLRVVFDGSAKTTSGLSLNDVQFVGPTVQDDLFAIILRFRQHRYVLSADIAKMYRQIRVQEKDRGTQRILWRTSTSLPIKTFQLNTVTYGTASAPFLATRVLKQLGEIHAIKFPSASRAIIKDFYVDDLLTGTNSIYDAKKLKNEISAILDSAGFELRKWATNDIRIFTRSKGSREDIPIDINKDPKTLGLLWNPERDDLRYTVKAIPKQRVTKRLILSEIAKIFDPLGLIGPATIQAKLILQELWQRQLTWDESLPQQFNSEWSIFRKDLEELNKISICRRVLIENPTSIQLHGFCDASEKAYGACIYLRSTDHEGRSVLNLLCAKSRVAPLKSISLPRLELCGAVLLAQLMGKVRNALNIEKCNEYYWCDSTITLAWIRASPNRWKTFVANRTSEIQNLTNGSWNHVPSEQNPADIISRGMKSSLLASSVLWWNGPGWLLEDERRWPSAEVCTTDPPEQRQDSYSFVNVSRQDMALFNRHSNLNQLIRSTAYCIRFITNIRDRIRLRKDGNATSNSTTKLTSSCISYLTTHELTQATKRLLLICQADAFAEEIKLLTSNRELPKASKLSSLNPFVDDSGVIRVGGRLHNASIPFDHKHPVVLPSKHRLTSLIITYEHLRLLHAGCQATVASLRTRYWIISCKNTVKGILRQYTKCFRARPTNITQIMGNLPTSRVTPRRPFHTCGVDYAGPFLVKDRTRSKTVTKAYLCVFVCFVTKAIHLELAIDLTTNAFINCLRRFVARRGLCHSIYSDNGTNFIGARNELNDLADLLQTKNHNKLVTNFLSTRGTQWHLIPPRAPHFGGLWESAVKSAKYHIKRVIGDTRLTYEELYTFLTQVEAWLNSRPLYPVSSDPHDITPLTPGHFLIGCPLTSPLDSDLRDRKDSLLNRYQHIQKMFQHFWHRWQMEYLHQLQQRNKWRSSTSTNFGIDTLVVIKEDNLPPLRWRLGRITELHPGNDKVTRVVSIRTSDGIIKRPITKICILPVQEDVDAENSLSGLKENE